MFDTSNHDDRRQRIHEAARVAYREARAYRSALRGDGVDPLTEYLRAWDREVLRDRLLGWLPPLPLLRDAATADPWRAAWARRQSRYAWWNSIPSTLGLAARNALRCVPVPQVPGRVFWFAALPLLVVGTAAAAHLAVPGVTERVAQTTIRLLFPQGGDVVADLQSQLDCATRIAVRDATGQMVGWSRKNTRCKRHLAEPVAVHAEWPEVPDFRTASIPPDQAERFGKIIELVEGGHTRGRATLASLNLVGLIRGVASLPMWLCCGEPIVGGSNGLLTGAKALRSDSGTASWSDKFRYIRLNLLLGSYALPDDASRHHWVVMTLPAAQGASGSRFGPRVAGGLLASVVFGKDGFADLSTAELCILAAAIKRNIRIISSNTPDAARAEARKVNEWIRQRATTRCANAMEDQGSISAPEAAALRAEIAAVQFPIGQTLASVNPDLMLRSHLPGARSLVADFCKRRCKTRPR